MLVGLLVQAQRSLFGMSTTACEISCIKKIKNDVIENDETGVANRACERYGSGKWSGVDPKIGWVGAEQELEGSDEGAELAAHNALKPNNWLRPIAHVDMLSVKRSRGLNASQLTEWLLQF